MAPSARDRIARSAPWSTDCRLIARRLAGWNLTILHFLTSCHTGFPRSHQPDIPLLDATSSVKFTIPQILRSIALRLRGGTFGSILRFQCQPAKHASVGSHSKYDAAEDPPQRGQNGLAPLPLPPEESRRADASKSEQESQHWPGEPPRRKRKSPAFRSRVGPISDLVAPSIIKTAAPRNDPGRS